MGERPQRGTHPLRQGDQPAESEGCARLTPDDKTVSEQRTAAEQTAAKAAAERQRHEAQLRDSLDRTAVQNVLDGTETASETGDEDTEFFD